MCAAVLSCCLLYPVLLLHQAKVLLRELEEVSPKAAATARDHADKSKALQQRAVKLVSVWRSAANAANSTEMRTVDGNTWILFVCRT